MPFQSTKTFGHETGLSAVFRQWRADSHCNQLHGYALAFKFTFESDELDVRNWVMDFGALSNLKKTLQIYFDHKLVVAQDDPQLGILMALENANLAEVVILDGVGCEKFAELAWSLATDELRSQGLLERIRVVEVECSEHGANSAIYRP